MEKRQQTMKSLSLTLACFICCCCCSLSLGACERREVCAVEALEIIDVVTGRELTENLSSYTVELVLKSSSKKCICSKCLAATNQNKFLIKDDCD